MPACRQFPAPVASRSELSSRAPANLLVLLTSCTANKLYRHTVLPQAKDYKYVGSQKQNGGIVIRDMEAAAASGAGEA